MNKNIIKGFKEYGLIKGQKTGVYVNNSENRKLGRVGQKYSKEDEEAAIHYKGNAYILKDGQYHLLGKAKRRSSWVDKVKPEVIVNLDKARIKDPEARKTILNFEKRVNTCREMLARGSSWDAMNYSQAYNDASLLLEELNEGGDFEPEKAKFWEEWKAYCEVEVDRNYQSNPRAHLGDWLA